MDRHLGVQFLRSGVPADTQDDASAQRARLRHALETTSCGFAKAELIPPGIGDLKMTAFAEAWTCGRAAIAAMTSLGRPDALIVNVRENGGGDPHMVALVSSFLFAERTHLNDIYDRTTDRVTEYWTFSEVPGRQFPDQPVFVLTSRRTFSAAEEFAYNLQQLGRATIIGETTAGGAHPTQAHAVDDRFIVTVPFARAVNPISGTNWEGVGVEPDMKVEADQAFDVAMKLAANSRGLRPARSALGAVADSSGVPRRG